MTDSKARFEETAKRHINMPFDQNYIAIMDMLNTLAPIAQDDDRIAKVLNELVPKTFLADGIFSDGEKRLYSKLRQSANDNGCAKEIVGYMNKYKFDQKRYDEAVSIYKGLNDEVRFQIDELIITLCCVDGRINKQEEDWLRDLMIF